MKEKILSTDVLLEGEPDAALAPAAAPIVETPAPAAATVDTPADGSDNFDFASLLTEDADEEVPAEPIAPAATPIETPKLAEAPVVVAPEPVVAPVAPIAPEPVSTPAPDAEAQRAEYQRREKEFKTNLSKIYSDAIPEDVKDSFLPEQVKVLTEIAATQHVNLLQATVSGIMAQLPQFVDNYMQQRDVVRERERVFYDKWPKLKGHDATVRNILSTYLASNANAKLDDVMQQVGAMAMIATRQTMDLAAPATPAPAGFSPVVPQGGGGGSIRPAQKTTWDDMANEFSQEDLG